MSPLIDQQKALEAVAQEFAAFLPPENRGGDLEGIFLTPTSQMVCHVMRENGGREGVGGNNYRLYRALVHLREVMFVPGAGTWYTTKMTLDEGGRLSTEFDYDSEPHWDSADVDPVAYVNDFKKFPRDEANQPAWLKSKLVEGREGIRSRKSPHAT